MFDKIYKTLTFCIAVLVILFINSGHTASAAPISYMETSGIRVCPAVETQVLPPDFSLPECKSVTPYTIDPQNTYIWVKLNISLQSTRGPNGEPLALYVSGKMASEFYLNGHYIGHNGKPSISAFKEVAGRMDTVFYPEQSLLKRGQNEVVFRASSHLGVLKLHNPLHYIGIDIAGNATHERLRSYWPSLVTLGIFILGALYYGIASFLTSTGTGRRKNLTLSFICGFAGAQLLAEILRGLVSYTYPIHDLRLIAITVFSAGFGLSVLYHILNTFTFKYVGRIVAGALLVCGISIALIKGFDAKATFAMMIPLIIGLFATGLRTYQSKPRAFIAFLALLGFVLTIFIFPTLFLDVLFFYLVAALLLVLFIEEGFAFRRESRIRRTVEGRANRLELALEQAREREQASEVCIKSAGKMERISTDQILHCRGAGSYTEIITCDGKTLLHTVSLSEMEEILPNHFLRVHRSHLVNTVFVKSLNRDPSGTGTLVLADNSEIPVSRRIMPQVRKALM